MTSFFADKMLLSDGWAKDVIFTVDMTTGLIQTINANQTDLSAYPDIVTLTGPVIPAMHNLHSHAFQRAMAGLSEKRVHGQESFWSWRDIMYQFLQKITPEDITAIAAQLYMECLKFGYASVGEFHYLHHDTSGAPYGNLAEHSHRIIDAAQQTGIALTHLPVLYAYAGFKDQPLQEGQKRFATSPTMIMDILTASKSYAVQTDHAHNITFGVAPHSLRAVSAPMLREMDDYLTQWDAQAPIHIHIAEQMKEVMACQAATNQRPVEYLANIMSLNKKWCLIHATHLTDHETSLIAQSGAIAGLCPTTEGNLGDGIFPFKNYLSQKGNFGIGSDSHVSRSPIEELRLLEYSQRFLHQERAVSCTDKTPSVGATLWKNAALGGAQALNINSGCLEVGKRADFLTLDFSQPDLFHMTHDQILDALIFNGNENLIKDSFVAGQHIIQNKHHPAEERITYQFKRTLTKLMNI